MKIWTNEKPLAHVCAVEMLLRANYLNLMRSDKMHLLSAQKLHVIGDTFWISVQNVYSLVLN